MKWLKNFSIKELFFNKKFAVSFSIIVAFVFWLVIVIDQNPEREITFNSVPVSISATGTNLEKLEMDIVSKSISDTVSVTVKGPSYVVSSLKSDDLLVTAELSGIDKVGQHTLTLIAKKISGKTDYEIVSINPSTVIISVDKIKDEYFDVEVEAKNVLADVDSDPALICEKPDVLEQKINIKGPLTELDKIETVKAIVSDDVKLTATKTFIGEIKLYDSRGDEIDPSPFTMSYDTAEITAIVSKRATVKVVPTFINKPANAPDLKYTIKLSSGESISSIDIQGPPDIINSLTEIQLKSIDFSTISIGNNSFEVELDMPSDAIKTVDNILALVVQFDLSDYSETSIGSLNVSVSNSGGNLTIDRSSIKNVKIYAPKSIIKSIKASNFAVVADLAGKAPGDAVTVTITSSINGVWAFGTYTVSVRAK